MPRKSTGRTGKRSSGRSSAHSTISSKKSSKATSNRVKSPEREGKVLSISRGRKSSPESREMSPSGSSQARALTDHEEIQQWAEERDARPACVRGTGNRGDIGMIRLDFLGYSGERSLEEIEWDDWFQKFDDSGLALLVQDERAQGESSDFNKLVKRESAQASRSGQKRRTA